jgi:2-iminobutanoate/2-iminopropanoate deaminase
MKKKIIKTDRAPVPVGPYNQAVCAKGFIFTSGQIPLDPKGHMVEGTVREQTEQVMRNLIAVLEKGGSSLEKVVKTTVFLKDLNDFSIMNEVYGKYFKAKDAPSRSAIQVARLPKDALVEIEAVAVVAA